MRLTVSRDFFIQFAKRTWLSPYSVVMELVEDSYDEDSTRLIVTVSDDYIVVEDDAGMDEKAVERFLVVGSAHKQLEPYSPKFGRARTGRYGVGRMSFLAFFNAMKVKTRKGGFSACFLIDEECLAGLASGKAEVKALDEPPMERDGSEIWLLQPRSKVNPARILEDLRELPILREPFFEAWFRVGEFKPWSLEGAERVKPREVMGEKTPFKLEDGIVGEITIAYRPLTEREKGILIMHGGHAVMRSTFGLPPSELSRITGWVRYDKLTTRFADKAAIIEDEAYERFQKTVKHFLLENVIPKAVQVEKGMTYEESRIFMEIDRLLSKVIVKAEEPAAQPTPEPTPQPTIETTQQPPPVQQPVQTAPTAQLPPLQTTPPQLTPQPALQLTLQPTPQPAPVRVEEQLQLPHELAKPVEPPKPLGAEKAIKPLKREVSLLRLGFRVVPYDDESDEREFFVEENVIYVNRGHPAYRKELKMGREVLRRHILRIVASALASAQYPENEALEYANKLIAEAISRF